MHRSEKTASEESHALAQEPSFSATHVPRSPALTMESRTPHLLRILEYNYLAIGRMWSPRTRCRDDTDYRQTARRCSQVVSRRIGTGPWPNHCSDVDAVGGDRSFGRKWKALLLARANLSGSPANRVIKAPLESAAARLPLLTPIRTFAERKVLLPRESRNAF